MSKLQFNNKTTRFSLLNALQLAHAAELAYLSESQIVAAVLDKWKFDSCYYFEKNHTQAFLAINDDMMIVSFRGTESLEDWLTDLKAKLLSFAGVRIHTGFHRGLEQVWLDLKAEIDNHYDGRRKLWLTGHSLGGALATLATDRLLEDYDVKGLYTYGQPRVGDKKFRRRFDRKFRHRTFRFVNDEDVVTRVPPRNLGYFHVGRVRYFDAMGAIHHELRWWRKFLSKSVSNTVRASDRFGELRDEFPGGIKDHNMGYYIKNIRKHYLQWKKINDSENFTFKDHINS